MSLVMIQFLKRRKSPQKGKKYIKQPTNDLSTPILIDHYVEKGSIVMWLRKKKEITKRMIGYLIANKVFKEKSS